MEGQNNNSTEAQAHANADQQANPLFDGKQTQEQIDEMRKQIELSHEYENQLKKEVAEQMPFISELLETSLVALEYEGTKFEESFKLLVESKENGGRGYKHIRRLRRDGNCFYRAFLFQLFEHYAMKMDQYKTQYDNLIKIVEKSKDELVQHGGYDLIVIEDFYDIFLDKLKGLAGLKEDHKKCKDDMSYEKFVEQYILNQLANQDEANYIIMYLRFMAASYIKENAILYEDFLGGDIAGFCTREIEQVDVECDHIQIIAITNYLQQQVEINGITEYGQTKINETKIPEDGFPNNDFRIKVLFVPGHYDALYD